MLLELSIRNFAVIREMRLEFAPGLNALTGETGAGKSIVIDALGAVLGARTSSEFVRTGERSAYVEAVFDLSNQLQVPALSALLSDLGIEGEHGDPLVLSREITSAGRSIARVNGRTIPASTLAQLGGLLVDIHGQSEHLSLLRPAAQLDLLDRYAGVFELRAELGSLLRAWRDVGERIQNFENDQRDRAQRIDLLRFQADELQAAALQPGEDDVLTRERDRLNNAERLVRLAASALAALDGDPTGSDVDAGVLDRLRAADTSLTDITSVDPDQETLLTGLRDAMYLLEEIAGTLRDYGERVAFDPDRLEEIEERLDLLRRLKRKYGPDLDDVLRFSDRVAGELAEVDEDAHDIDALRLQERALHDQVAVAAHELSLLRRDAATQLSHKTEATIHELNMGRADFSVAFEMHPDPSGVEIFAGEEPVSVDSTGVDRITFLLAANAGEEQRPLARVASGGETARLMLALKSILSDADSTPTLVFDEIDVGVGGRSGQVVGEKLWGLTSAHQAIVISHLAQIAAFADRHLRLVKREVNQRTETSADLIEGDERIEELAAMFDGLPPTPESRANAIALCRRVDAWKIEHGAALRSL